MIESELLSIKILLAKVRFKIGQEKYSLSILCLKIILRRIKLACNCGTKQLLEQNCKYLHCL